MTFPVSLERLVKIESTNIHGQMTAVPFKVAQEARNVAISYPTGTSRRSLADEAPATNFWRISANPKQNQVDIISNYRSKKKRGQSDMYFSQNRLSTPMARVLKKKLDPYEKTVYRGYMLSGIRRNA